MIPQGRRYLTYRLVPKANGKTDKIPVDPRTGATCSPHDKQLWMTAEEINGPLALVVSEDDPYFMFDLDDCLNGDEWSPLAQTMCQVFAGCYIEVSQSGRGLHIIGSIPEKMPHGCRNTALGLELYTSGRFFALTGTHAIGDAAFTPSVETYRWLVDSYFPPGAAVDPGAEWTTEPRAEWSGPTDDDELIQRMLRSKSARAVLGGTASIQELWNADADALSRAYPDSAGDQGRAFDWSLADAALCAHLAWWTGGDCERIERLFERSALADRDKWRDRDDYRQTTILRAVGQCSGAYKQPDAAVPVVAPESGIVVRQGVQFLDPAAQVELFAGCVYVRDAHRVFTPDGGMLKPEQFKTMYGGYIFAMDALGEKSTRNAWEVFTESQAISFPKVISTIFRPELPPGQIIDGQLNSYVPLATREVDGDPGPFLDLLSRMFPVSGDREILLAYMAACVQHIGVKFQWCPVLQGGYGNGKTFIGECLVQAIGEKYSHLPDSKDLGNVFNSWLSGKLLIVVEEVYAKEKIDTIETLKWMVTNRRVPVQRKGADQTTGDNRANFLMLTNHQDAIQKTKDDRRFAPFFAAQQTLGDLTRDGMVGDYFPRLYQWAQEDGYAIVNHYLRQYRIPDALNPATCCHRAPITSSTGSAIESSLGTWAQVVQEAIQEGRPGFSGGWISSIAMARLLDRASVRQRGDVATELGYIKHPGLKDGRLYTMIPVEQGKPRLYVIPGHLSTTLKGGGAIAEAYSIAQGYMLEDQILGGRAIA